MREEILNIIQNGTDPFQCQPPRIGVPTTHAPSFDEHSKLLFPRARKLQKPIENVGRPAQGILARRLQFFTTLYKSYIVYQETINASFFSLFLSLFLYFLFFVAADAVPGIEMIENNVSPFPTRFIDPVCVHSGIIFFLFLLLWSRPCRHVDHIVIAVCSGGFTAAEY